MDDDPTTGFRKLNFLLRNPPFPPPTFGNLLLLYCKFYHYDLAADVLAENTQLTYKMLSGQLYEFLDACIMVQTSPEEAYRKFDDLTNKHIEGKCKRKDDVDIVHTGTCCCLDDLTRFFDRFFFDRFFFDRFFFDSFFLDTFIYIISSVLFVFHLI